MSSKKMPILDMKGWPRIAAEGLQYLNMKKESEILLNMSLKRNLVLPDAYKGRQFKGHKDLKCHSKFLTSEFWLTLFAGKGSERMQKRKG